MASLPKRFDKDMWIGDKLENFPRKGFKNQEKNLVIQEQSFGA